MFTIIADGNIAHLHDYFNESILKHPINVIEMAGRDITAAVIAQHQPDALLIRSVTQVNAALMDNNHSIKFIGSATIGTDHVDESYLTQRGISFSNAAGSSKHSVAQYVMTAILQLRLLDNKQNIAKSVSAPITLGIIGLGNIGSTLARYAQDMGWRVLGYDPFLPASTINNACFEEVLAQSQVISVHVPLTYSDNSNYPTYHLIDSVALQKIPTETLLINTARGAVISEQALINEFHETREVGDTSQRQVVLDVFEYEPTVAAHLIKQLSIATPHIAGYTLEGKLRGTQMVFDAFLQCFDDLFDVHNPQIMNRLLPYNPYHWQTLKANLAELPRFYDIYSDDDLLRAEIQTNRVQTNSTQTDRTQTRSIATETIATETFHVPAAVFDALRKDYTLRREWLFDKEAVLAIDY